MFGELLGLWAGEVWAAMGRPESVKLMEVGPGRGTLMSDALRAARAVPGFAQSLEIHLVETSPVLRARQAETLGSSGFRPTWHECFEDVPPGPALVIANEFLDALPIRQFVATERGWCERLVGLDENGELAFGLAPEPTPGLRARGEPGAVLEIGVQALAAVGEIAGRVTREGGAALLIDYGHEGPALGDTLQAVKDHRPVDPLADPGAADLTAHVDFCVVRRAATQAGAAVHGPVAQGAFLRSLGIEIRAERLKRRATPAQAAAVDSALERLTGDGEGAMGALFKVLAVTDPALPAPPGFEAPAAPRAFSPAG
jgi:SAM-dependent MidA family methyltransferase